MGHHFADGHGWHAHADACAEFKAVQQEDRHLRPASGVVQEQIQHYKDGLDLAYRLYSLHKNYPRYTDECCE